ncbi:MAG: DUF2520 domain-containing protein [Flavobacteriales bacterium]|nr:DUF2520 domain-containing protein [Flavobacteriales bacterium]
MSTVLLIGTGRLAFHLGHALRRSGVELAGVVGRDMGKTQELAKALECPAFGLADALPPADLRMLAVSDDAIATVAEGLPRDGTPVVHASGSKSLVLLSGHAHRGVLWPIQSFSPGPPIDFSDVPLVVDADDAGTLSKLQALAGRLSSTVVHLPFAKRQRLHLSAVITSNFPVFLLREAERLLLDHGIDPGLVHPLWKASSEKALLNADQAVTGPARRGDVKTIEQQLQLLSDEPDLRRAYAALSDLIFRTYHAQHRDQQDL